MRIADLDDFDGMPADRALRQLRQLTWGYVVACACMFGVFTYAIWF